MGKKIIGNAFNRINQNIQPFVNKKDIEKEDIKINAQYLQEEWDKILINSYFTTQYVDNIGQMYSSFLKNQNVSYQILKEKNIKLERTPELKTQKFAYTRKFIHLFLPKLEEILKETNEVDKIVEQIKKENITMTPVKSPTPIKEDDHRRFHKKSTLNESVLNHYINEIVEDVNEREYVTTKFKI